MKGYEQLRNEAAWKDLSARGRILVHGEDNARLLHAMSSNHIEGLEDGEGIYTFFLNSQGRIQSDASILRSVPDFLIDTEASTAAALFAHIDKYIIADDVTLEDLGATHFAFGVEGPQAASAAAALSIPVPPNPYGVAPFEGGYAARLNETGLDGVRVTIPIADREQWMEKLASLAQAGDEAWETVRHEQGKPRFGAEILDKHLVQETRLPHAVHFSKGCYLGQEIVERVRARGAVHRGLAALTIEAIEAPATGAEILSGSHKAGAILSAVFSPAEHRVVAFGMLSTEALAGHLPLQCAGSTAELRASSAFGTR